jgi:hypothetical protein
MGIVHRDIKPSNLLLDRDGHLWVTDFGLAMTEAGKNLTMSGDVLGTLRYMSPEQASGSGKLLDRRTDVYSLGATLYELLALKPAFSSRERQQLLRQVLEEEPTPLRRLDPKIPVDLETIIARATAKERELRYHTAQELADDLRRFLEDRPILARPASRLEKTWRWYRRSPLVAGLSLAVLMLLLIVTGSALLFAQRETAQRRVAEHNAEEAHWQQYLSDMHTAMAAWEDSDVGRTLELLERHRPKPGEPDLRGFEWNYLWRQCHDDRLLATINETRQVWGVEFSHDGRLLATAGASGLAKLWDSASGRLIHELDGNRVITTSVAFSPDDRILAVGGKGIDLWDLESRGTLRVMKVAGEDVIALVFSSDGQRLARGQMDHSLRIWDVASGNELRTIRPDVHEHPATLVPKPPWDRQRLWTGARDGKLRLFDTDSGAELRMIRRDELSLSSLATFAISEDGKLAATGSLDGIIWLVDVETAN